jgi:hypothetical protein
MDPQGIIRRAVNRMVGRTRRTISAGLGRAANFFGRGQGRGGIVNRSR